MNITDGYNEIGFNLTQEIDENDSIGDDYSCAYCGQYATARAVAPKIPALLSVIGSYIILRELWVAHPRILRERGLAVQRILLAMSVSDVFFSMPYVFTTWLAPREIDELWQSSGSFATCTLQGWSIQFGVSTSPLFSLALTLCAMLTVRYNWNPTRMWKLEVWIHSLIWGYGLLASVPLVFFQMYNPTMTTCWIASYPRGCKDTRTFGDEADCERGDGASYIGGAFAFFPTWPALFFSFIFLLMTLFTVRDRENIMSRYAGSLLPSQPLSRLSRLSRGSSTAEGKSTALSTPSESLADDVKIIEQTFRKQEKIAPPQRQINRQRSDAVVRQVVLYTIFFFLTFSLDTYAILKNLWSGGWLNPVVNVVAYMLFPMQGFFNLIIFVLPRRRNMRTWEGRMARSLLVGEWIRPCLRNTLATCCPSNDHDQSSVHVDESSGETNDSTAQDRTPIQTSSLVGNGVTSESVVKSVPMHTLNYDCEDDDSQKDDLECQ